MESPPAATGGRIHSRLHLDLPRLAHFAGEHLVRFLVIEAFLDRIPLELLSGPQGYDAHVADAHGTMADLRGAYGRFACLDAIQEIAHMIVRLVEPRGILGQRLLNELLVTGGDDAAV